MHFSLISLKSFNRGPAAAPRCGAAAAAAAATSALQREFSETQNKIDNKLLVFEAAAWEPPSSHQEKKEREYSLNEKERKRGKNGRRGWRRWREEKRWG